MSEALDNIVINDLMRKAAEDATNTLFRVLDIAPDRGRLPIAMAAGGSILGVAAAILDPRPGDIEPETLLLAALILGRSPLKEKGDDPIAEAYRDLTTLVKAGRIEVTAETRETLHKAGLVAAATEAHL